MRNDAVSEVIVLAGPGGEALDRPQAGSPRFRWVSPGVKAAPLGALSDEALDRPAAAMPSVCSICEVTDEADRQGVGAEALDRRQAGGPSVFGVSPDVKAPPRGVLSDEALDRPSMEAGGCCPVPISCTLRNDLDEPATPSPGCS